MPYSIASLDNILGPIGTFVTCIYGPAGSGKTTLVLQIIAEALRTGEQVLFIDAHSGLSMERLQQLVGDRAVLKRFLVKQVNTFQEQEMMIIKLPNLVEDFGLIVVDSIGSFYRTNLREYHMKRAFEMDLRILTEIAKQVPVVITNHVYDDLKNHSQRMLGEDLVTRWSEKQVQLLSKEKKIIVTTSKGSIEGRYEIGNQGLTLVH